MPGGTAPQREDADDHDVLTYSEVAVRLHEEVVAQRALVASLEARGDLAAAGKARARLALLEEAVERNGRRPLNAETFERFFGYPDAARPGP